MNENLFSMEPEIAVISLILNAPELVFNLKGLKSFMFSATATKEIFDAIETVVSSGLVPDIHLIENYLKSKDKLEQVGGIEYLGNLKNQKYNSSNLVEYETEVINNYKAKNLLSLGANLSGMLKKVSDVDSVMNQIRNIIDNLTITSGGDSTVEIKDVVDIAFNEIELRTETPGIRGLTTGLRNIDLVTTGFNKGDLWIICGRPGCLSGDTIININRAGKGFKTTLKNLHKMFNGGETKFHQKWNLSIPTMIQSYYPDGTIRLSKISGVVNTGFKALYWVGAKSGKYVKASRDHRFLTKDGWKTTKELVVGDSLFVSGVHSSNGITRNKNYRSIYAVHHKNENKLDNSIENLEVMLKSEHLRFHGKDKCYKHVCKQAIEDVVESVSLFSTEDTYDIQLENEPHNFLANDIVVHNSGKTALMCNTALIGAKKGVRSLIFELEMSKQQLIERMLSIETKIELTKIRMGQINKGELAVIKETLQSFKDLPIYIDTNYLATPTYVEATIRKYKKSHDINVTYLDNINLLVERDEGATHALGRVSRLEKLLANELELTNIIVSQLNRGVEQRDNKRPQLSDLRQSGNLEEDADLVIGLYRDSYYNKNSEKKDTLESIILKQRNGPTGTIMLDCDMNTNYIGDK